MLCDNKVLEACDSDCHDERANTSVPEDPLGARDEDSSDNDAQKNDDPGTGRFQKKRMEQRGRRERCRVDSLELKGRGESCSLVWGNHVDKYWVILTMLPEGSRNSVWREIEGFESDVQSSESHAEFLLAL